MKKIILIQPSPYDQNRKPLKKKKLYFAGLALPLLAALTPKDYEVEIVFEILEDIPFETDADIVGISSMGHGVIRSIDIAMEFKKRGKTVILGGYMASIMAEEAQKYCDAVLIGDAELVWEELLRDCENGTLKPVYKNRLEDGWFSTPPPRFDLITNKNLGDFLPVQAGRGCPHSCSFCSVACLYEGSYVKKPIAEVVRDIKQIKELGYRKFLLLDDNIFADKVYLSKLIEEIKALDMQWMSQCDIRIGKEHSLLDMLRDSGCTTLSFGLESLKKESLKAMNKAWANPDDYPALIRNIQDHGIDVSTEMVVGGEADTLESIKATKDFIEDNKISVPRFYILTPIPGTQFFKDMEALVRLVKTDIYSFDGTEAVHTIPKMTPEELTKAYWKLYESLFTFKSIAKRNIFRKEFLREPGKYLFYSAVNLYYRHQIKRRVVPNIF
ncbi:MAG TPA: radical SAM protein [Desulfosporosinus sp.]